MYAYNIRDSSGFAYLYISGGLHIHSVVLEYSLAAINTDLTCMYNVYLSINGLQVMSAQIYFVHVLYTYTDMSLEASYPTR